MDQITILIISDNPVILRGLKSLLEEDERVAIAGNVKSDSAAIQWMSHSSADVILMDISMPEIDGIKSVSEIIRVNPKAKILILTNPEGPSAMAKTILAGAKGYILYGKFDSEELITAVQEIASGKTIIDPVAAARTLADITTDKQLNQSNKKRRAPGSLTQREVEVLNLIGKGKNNAEIACILSIGEKTVKNHINSIYGKLSIRTRYEAILIKLELDLKYDF
ncbi:MAG: response regulator transcription factor [Chloroflexota bacterium]|nr:response regulator transcription factor [Chloroflexota bacterium]